MKKLLLLGAGVLLAGAAHAQLGLRAGANYATLSTKTGDYNRTGADGRVGYQVGVFYEKKLNEHFSVVPEVQFSHQRTYLEVDSYVIADANYSARYQLTLNYLNVPVLLRANYGRLYLEAGPQASILQSARETGSELIGGLAGSYRRGFNQRRATDSYRRFDVSVVAGVGLKLPAGFGVGLRVSTGLLSLERAPQYAIDPVSLKNQVVQAAVSYQLNN